ncbi:hypothetical protein MKJ01_10130 [Chryseobacterium sp. SSA4.19]|uniref:hypothetical protein n=1 Tax=Chryseobacterium sp. SSA4.19 TaxID=2919915 RepID=UPI001F4D5725|nr:hypothetical protein [Chryseobacterium sp. SSA4.19]MCJ8154116.1 hypothetical protein [Chryseobacterium sp. SSA4.19]
MENQDYIKNDSAVILEKLKAFKYKNRSLKHDPLIYLNKVINEFESTNFISVSLIDLERIKQDIGSIPNFKKKFNGRKKITSFKDEILSILDYKNKRTVFYPKYFSDLGIKCCVYCNSQLTIVVTEKHQIKNSNPNEYIAKFQLDHYYPKDKYPHLSISLFNLYPVCSSCNLAKSNNENVDFKLYADRVEESKFSFELDNKSKALFLLSRNSSDLRINFKNKFVEDYVDVFNIDEIYKTQYDVAEEIILKSLIYNGSYRKSIVKEFLKHRVNDSLFKRFILGNYTADSEIHKRPNAKFMQDIGKQVGLI